MAEEKPFRIALTSAGAVSGGPYSAGVIDFIIEALDAWYAAKKRGEAVPSHDVRIDAVSGTSAGAVAAGLFPAAVIRSRQPSGSRRASLLWDVWVNSLDLMEPNHSRGFLGCSDLQGNGDAIPSLLNSHRLDDVAAQHFSRPWDTGFQFPPWLSTALRIIVCVTNIAGIPYRVSMAGSSPGTGHAMYMHGDHGDFVFGPLPNPLPPDLTPLDPHGVAGWNILQDWVLASSAFPIGLAQRKLHSNEQTIATREWTHCGPEGCEPITSTTSLHPGEPFDFTAVDGGMINNEPFELARQVLLPDVCEHLCREGNLSRAAVVLIDPFPSPYDENSHRKIRVLPSDIMALAPHLLSTMVQQCRFKPAELELATDENVYSRFLVAPSGGGPSGVTCGDDALAGGGLGAFAGFIYQAFRVHDYQLGRRNAQQFLRCHFALPLDNPLFEQDRAHYRTDGALCRFIEPCNETKPVIHVPIIPLTGSAAATIPAPQWPTVTPLQVRKLADTMEPRLDAIMDRLARKAKAPMGWKARWLIKVLWWCKKGDAQDGIREYIQKELTRRGQCQ